ncbi:Crp/Fnr family transcriptional regulator [Vibrio brasiliensis]|jgi:CRP-like cAMP-binding protein|uniref:Crp/Fnr family transcriptional regulator n=1 Tax=Vibrio brasiliensis TaxID=170652 RepID=UPI001EFE3CFF|nr:Crp/Fnr family transcriptional regulator [Vibrio brasiliensis]MCG9752229.1 Crp/Fnr family transcriptional regulator [Vibrio brasiliensis]MCG9784074.1 Crp/Fnr family transcriptional regulator [Vibrio brasiliensis]
MALPVLAPVATMISRSAMSLATRTFQTDEYLLRQGQAINELYWVDIGQFSIVFTAKNARRYSFGLNFVDNHLFGEDEFLTSSPCQFDVQASEMIEARVIPIAVMLEVLQQDARIVIWLSRSMLQRYQDGMANTMNRLLHPLMYNVANDIYQRHIGTKPAVNFSQIYKEAERFGSSERVYSRVVTQLIEMQLIVKSGNQLVVKDRTKLKSFLEQA